MAHINIYDEISEQDIPTSYETDVRNAFTDPYLRIGAYCETDYVGRSFPAEKSLSWLRLTLRGGGNRQGQVRNGMVANLFWRPVSMPSHNLVFESGLHQHRRRGFSEKGIAISD